LLSNIICGNTPDDTIKEGKRRKKESSESQSVNVASEGEWVILTQVVVALTVVLALALSS